MRDFPSIAAICEPDHVLPLPCMFESTKKRSQQLLGTVMFVSKLVLLSCAVFGMTRFAEWQPELPGAQQRVKRAKCKITTVNIRRWIQSHDFNADTYFYMCEVSLAT